MNNCNRQIELFSDSVEMIYKPADLYPEIDWEAQSAQWSWTITFLAQTIENLNIIREASISDDLANAELINDMVTAGEVPELNQAYINEIEIQYIESDGDISIIRDNYTGIFGVASQCPFAGGPAVERARTFIAMINDSASYPDDAVCLQSGIYRISGDSIEANNEAEGIKIIPNPANNAVEIFLEGQFEGVCHIEIINSICEIVLADEMNCKENKHVLNISNLAQGIYIVKINLNNSHLFRTKLTIVR